MRHTAMLCLAMLANAASAAPDDDYATQWPITTMAEDAGAYGVMLDASVYREARSPALRDVDVVNAGGATVPAQLFRSVAGPAAEERRAAVRWFVLPRAAATAQGDWSLAVERAGDGRVLRVESRAADPGVRDDGPAAWLVDASDVDEVIEALHLDWTPEAGSLDRAWRVEASDDLRTWRVVQPAAQLVELARGDTRLVQRRVPVGTRARYLRLLPGHGTGAVRLRGMQAVLAPLAEQAPLQWRLPPGEAREEHGVRVHVFRLDGRFPVEAVDLQFDGNGTGRWTLYSREHAEAPWTLRAGPWVAYAIGDGTEVDRSAPQPLTGVVRDREWKLVPAAPVAQAPQLRLGWRPEVLVFVAQGAPPYRLVAGSVRAGRADAPVETLVEGLRRARGVDWRPGEATIGTMQPLAGERALQPQARRDWRTWLLWALLAGGALLVVGFAIGLLRKPEA